MTDPNPDLSEGAGPADPLDGLVAELAALTDETRLLRKATEAVVPTVEREARRGFWTRVLVAVMALVLVGVGGLAWSNYLTAESTAATAERLEGVVQRGLCPVYAVFIGGYRPETRAEGADRDSYNLQFRLLANAYAELRCTNGFAPPPIQR